MGKYRHAYSGRIVERDDNYAKRSKAFVPVDEDTPLSDAPCLPCGFDDSTAGVVDNEAVEVQSYEEYDLDYTEPDNSVEGE